jgi:ribosome-associated heat shock protein Hsp15
MSDGTSVRIDKWLWFARMAKTRSLAARLCSGGFVTVGGEAVTKPHHPVRIGEAVTIVQGRVRRHVVVQQLGARRGPPAEARLLYDEPAPPSRVALADVNWSPLLDEESWT